MAYEVTDRYQLQYFTGTQASIWIGEEWVSECFGIAFTATQNIIPIFGYASTTFDAVAKGRVLVQGSFEINFIDEGYLYYVLHKMNSRRLREPGEFNQSQYLLTGEHPISQSKMLEQVMLLSEKASIVSDKEASQIALEAMKDLKSSDIVSVDKAIRELDLHRKVAAAAGLRNNAKSIIYDIIPFHIQGIFGHPDLTDEVTEKKLLNCFLVSNEMLVAVDDQPLKERYSFIGQVHK